MPIQRTTTNLATGCVKIINYGEAGVGKTKLIATAPNPIIVSTERGLLSLRDYSIPAYEVNTSQELFEALIAAVHDNNSDTICVDSPSDMAQVLLNSYLKEAKDPRQAYGKMASDIVDMMKWLRDNVNKQVYCVAHVGKTKDDFTGLIKYAPAFPGQQLGSTSPYIFDEVFAMRMGQDQVTKENYRYIQTQPDVQYVAKDRSGRLDPIEYPDLTVIIEKCLGYR